MIVQKLRQMIAIDASHQAGMRDSAIKILLLGFGVVLVEIFAPFVPESLNLIDYLPLHTSLEFISISIAILIFIIGWKAESQAMPANILMLAYIFLGVAILDFSHTLSYSGMPDFITPSSPEKAIDFWLSARLMAALGLLFITVSCWSKPCPQSHRYGTFVLVLTTTLLIHGLLLFYDNLMPATFISGQGLTNFKVSFEYMLVAINALTLLLLWLRMKTAQPFNIPMLFAAVAAMAMSEYFFTLYSEVTDTFNFFGHIYKIISYWFLFRVAFLETYELPYQELKKSSTLYQAILENIPDMVFLKRASDLRFELFNRAGEELLGVKRELMLGRNDYDFFPQKQADHFTQKDREVLENQQEMIEIPQEEVTTSAGIRVLHTKKIAIRDEKGAPLYLLGISEDITHRHQHEKELMQLSLAVEQSPNSIVITDLDGNIEYVNKSFVLITGYRRDEVIGKNPRILQSGKTPKETYAALWDHITHGHSWQGELINKRKNGDHYIEYVMITPVRNSQGETINYLAIKEDITQRKEDEAQIKRLAHLDQLTELPNRQRFSEYFDYLAAKAKRESQKMTLIFLDLDHFKNINDTLGHSIGDKLLLQVTQLIKSSLRASDIISRFGGDEFTLLLPDTQAPGAAEVCNKLKRCVSQPVNVETHELFVSASMGIAIYPNDGDDLETLLKKADMAMYRAKSLGRNEFCFFTEKMQAEYSHQMKLTHEIRHALDLNQFYLLYQPQISMATGKIVGAEALLRWKHPSGKQISPAEFIPVAESNGQIINIGKYVLRTAAAQLKTWISKGLPTIKMAVNISAVQFKQKDISQKFSDIIDEIDLPKQLLELELTEAVLMEKPELMLNMLVDLQHHGIHMSIDDFGAGFSSLNYLKKFNAYKLKIDQSFIHGLSDSKEDPVIVETIINMAKSLGMITLAEGVETQEQFDFLYKHGCDEYQGYYYSKPVSAEEFEQLLKDQ